jgi:hypothetical protein
MFANWSSALPVTALVQGTRLLGELPGVALAKL